MWPLLLTESWFLDNIFKNFFNKILLHIRNIQNCIWQYNELQTGQPLNYAQIGSSILNTHYIFGSTFDKNL